MRGRDKVSRCSPGALSGYIVTCECLDEAVGHKDGGRGRSVTHRTGHRWTGRLQDGEGHTYICIVSALYTPDELLKRVVGVEATLKHNQSEGI